MMDGKRLASAMRHSFEVESGVRAPSSARALDGFVMETVTAHLSTNISLQQTLSASFVEPQLLLYPLLRAQKPRRPLMHSR